MRILPTLFAVAALGACSACAPEENPPPADRQPTAMSDMSEKHEPDPIEPEARPSAGKIVKTDAEWRAQLLPEEYQVTRRAGTEQPFTGRYWNHQEPGTYTCVCCGQELFDSDTKYDAGCGWPSFWKALAGERVTYIEDLSGGVVRTEVRCAKCDAHLGHVFEDGPRPTGQRYCMNSVSLKFVPRED